MVCMLTPVCCLTVQTFHHPEDMTICLPLRRYEISYFYSTYHLPLLSVGLQDGGAGAHDFSTLAPGIARGTHLLQAAPRGRHLWRDGQGALAGRLSRAIHIHNHQSLSPA